VRHGEPYRHGAAQLVVLDVRYGCQNQHGSPRHASVPQKRPTMQQKRPKPGGSPHSCWGVFLTHRPT
jgi:hypothetical protein